jgi:hypothetical protein
VVVLVSPELEAELEPVVEVVAAEQLAVAARVVAALMVAAGALQLQLRLLFPRQAWPPTLVLQMLHRHLAVQLPC